MAWLFPPLQTMVEYRATDTIIAVPAKSGTTWSMNIFYQLREGGDPDFADIYREIPWAEFLERPDQPKEELLERWQQMPYEIPRAFKTHASPSSFCEYNPNLKYLVVARNPEEAIVSMKPFMESHTDELWQLWGAEEEKSQMVRPDLNFEDWFFDIALKWAPPGPPGAPKPPNGMMDVFFMDFINGWWPYRNKPNVLMMHFADMKKDHEGSVRKIAAFLGMQPTAEQWPRILEYTSFKWMKEHEDKFEAATVAPVPLMKTGAMVRKGATGTQNEDGMTPKVVQAIKDILEAVVPDPEARHWFMNGGPLPGAAAPNPLPTTYATAPVMRPASSVTYAAPPAAYTTVRSATVMPAAGSVTYAAAPSATFAPGSVSMPAGSVTYGAPAMTYAAPATYSAPAPAQTLYTITPERFKLIMAGQPLTQEEIMAMTGSSGQASAGAASMQLPAVTTAAVPTTAATTAPVVATSSKKSSKKASKKKLSSKKKEKGCC